ncbi:uncharacterized protein LOC142639899 [Castanea sativa]|uniref:uncharacterized protein LOC142639899 n=1 Tax=Castanea sativa TaxID=21020 RepID=UPI003F652665
MREGETSKTYTNRYLEMFNEIDEDFDDVAIKTFKVGLLAEYGLRKSLTGKPVSNVRQLMDQIDKYKQVEENQQLGKGKAKVVSQDRREFRSDRYNDNRPRRDFTRQTGAGILPQAVNTVFREPVHQILEKIKNEPYFKWPNKMNGDPTRRNQNLHCQYHQERRHTTENCKNSWYHLEQLVKEERLQQFLYKANGQVGHTGLGTQGNTSSRPPLGTINVIFVTLGKVDSCPSQDRGNDVRRVMVDQGSGAEIMYFDLCRGLGLKPEDLTSYDSPLVGFNGKMVILMGQVKLPVQIGLEVVEVNFIVVDAYSPYTAIVARPWLHAMGAVPSTLHLKVKYPFGDWVEDLIGSQSTARQCMVVAIRHQS